MARILPEFKNAIIEEIKTNITNNTSNYYAFLAHPVQYSGNTPSETNDDYNSVFINDWTMIFGKKLSNTDIVPVIKNNIWAANSVYEKYDNTSNTLLTNTNFYVITEPQYTGGYYHIYKCIDNANNSNSTVDPSTISTPTQFTSFQTADNYIWRYITSISTKNYNKFSTSEYAPLLPNTVIQSSAGNNSGVEVVVVSNGGSYSSYTNGVVQSVTNSTYIQIQSNNSSSSDGFYNNCSVYFYNNTTTTGQLIKIVSYSASTNTNYIELETASNTSLITPGFTNYDIAPTVSFETDGIIKPTARCVMNNVSNSINSIVVLENGTYVSWANVSIETSLEGGSGANVYAIINSPGGHGSNPANELNVQGLGISFTFSNTESANLGLDILYNKIGLIKNPYGLTSNNEKGSSYSNSNFDQRLIATVSPSQTFNVGEQVTGDTSGARATVLFSNSTTLHLVGDQHFSNNESISNSSTSNVTSITISSKADIYYKDIIPVYIQNINNVNRSNNQSESYKLIIKF